MALNQLYHLSTNQSDNSPSHYFQHHHVSANHSALHTSFWRILGEWTNQSERSALPRRNQSCCRERVCVREGRNTGRWMRERGETHGEKWTNKPTTAATRLFLSQNTTFIRFLQLLFGRKRQEEVHFRRNTNFSRMDISVER